MRSRRTIRTLFVMILATAPLAAQEDRGEALREAAREGDRTAVEALLAAGVAVDSTNRYGTTALFFAADRGHREIVERLLEAGAEVDRTDTFYGFTPLLAALQKGNHEIVLLLLEHGSPGAEGVVFHGLQTGDARLVEAAVASGPLDARAHQQALESARASGAEAMVAILEEARVREPETEPPVTDPDTLAPLAGVYRDDASGTTVEVTLQEEGLVAITDEREVTLVSTGGQAFQARDDESFMIAFGGRSGTVEFVQLRDGDSFVGLRPVDPDEFALGDSVLEIEVEGGDIVSSPHWPSFRGRGAAGGGDGHDVPVEWDVESGENIAWRTPIPGIANASPIVWDDALYVTTAVSSAGDATVRTGLYGDVQPVEDVSPHSFRLYRLDRRTGEIVWEREVHSGAPEIRRHPKASQANSTPATDGEHVVVLFGSVGVLAAYTPDGELAWKNDLGALDSGWFWDPDVQWGHAASPVLYEDTVIVQADVQRGDSFLAAYRLTDGQEVWRTAREEIPTWGTPTVYRGRPRDELIVNGTTIRGYDPTSGEELWRLGPNSEVVVATPVVAGETVYVTAGYPPVRPIYAVKPGGEGDLSLPEGVDSTEHVVWSKGRGGTYIPTPLAYRGLLYTNANNGILTAYRLENGEMVMRARIGDVGGSFVASPVASDGRLYLSSEDGVVYVTTAGSHHETLAANDMGEVVWATPAITPGLLIVRTLHHVWGIGEAR